MNFKTFYIILLFFCAAFVGAGFGFAKVYQQRQEGRSITLPEATAFPQVSEQIYQYLKNDNNGSLALVGNISFDDSILLNSYDATWKSFSCDDMLNPVSSYLSHQGCLVGSMNGTFAGEGKGRQNRSEFGYGGSNYYNAPDDFANMLGDYGFDMLAMANYHTYDSNYSGLCQTKKTVIQNGMVPVGIFEEEEDVCEYETKDFGGISAAVFSYTEALKFKPGEENDFSVNQLFRSQEEYLKKLCKAVKQSKKLDADVAVVYIYFSNTRTGTVSSRQKEVAHQLLDAGADIVVGTNPDIIEPMEIRKSKTKEGHEKYQIALYSLGNFITGQTGRVGTLTRNTGMIARFQYDQDSTGTYLTSLSFSPTYCVSYPTVEEQEDAGAHVRVFSIPEVADYIEQGGSTRSTVKSTKPAVKRDQNGASQRTTADEPEMEETTEQIQETTVTTEISEATTQVSQETQSTPSTETQSMPEQDNPEATGISRSEKNRLLSLLGIQQVSALQNTPSKTFFAAKEEEMLVNEEYTGSLTRSDFSYLTTATKKAIDRLFSGSGYEYSYKDGWFYLKNLKK